MPFKFATDHLVLQTFWAGQPYHVEIQTSQCWANPKATAGISQIGLYAVEATDASAAVVIAVPPPHWMVRGLASAYAVITLGFVMRGLVAAFSRLNRVPYVPWTLTKARLDRWRLPSAQLELWCVPVEKNAQVLYFHGSFSVASSLWMNHWLYITISVLFSSTSIRTLYALLEVGTWMLSKHVSLENFLFVCTALTKITWITCLAHTLLRHVLQSCIAVVARLNPRGRRVYGFARWYVDAVALLVNFKIYSVLLALQLFCLLQFNGSTTVMKKRPGFKRPVYGGYPGLTSMWGSEIACDLLVMCSIQIVAAHLVASALLLTRLRKVTANALIQTLQRRYVFVGWDVFVTMDALGIDPFCDASGGLVTTRCTFAALIRQLYASGPSGWVHLAGEDAFSAMKTKVWLAKPHSHHRMYDNDIQTVSKRLDDVVVPFELTSFRANSFRADQSELACTCEGDTKTPSIDTATVAFQNRVLHLHVDSAQEMMFLVDAQDPQNLCRMRSATDAPHFLHPDEYRALVDGQLRICLG